MFQVGYIDVCIFVAFEDVLILWFRIFEHLLFNIIFFLEKKPSVRRNSFPGKLVRIILPTTSWLQNEMKKKTNLKVLFLEHLTIILLQYEF